MTGINPILYYNEQTGINPILYYNEQKKFPQIWRDYQAEVNALGRLNTQPQKDSPKEETDSISSIFDIIPTFRRIENVPGKVEHSDYIPAMGLVSLALLNAPEDWRDTKSAYAQIKAKMSRNPFTPAYDYKTAQHPFSFFRGTLLHKFVNPKTSPCPKFAKWLLKNDTTLVDTQLGDYVTKKFNINREDIETKIQNINSTKENPSFVEARRFVTKSKFGELTARAMTRTTKIGTAVLGSLEAAHLIKEIADGENAIKSAVKSAISLTSSIAGIGYGGAIGAKLFGPTGSLVGMGLGAIAGNKIAKLMD